MPRLLAAARLPARRVEVAAAARQPAAAVAVAARPQAAAAVAVAREPEVMALRPTPAVAVVALRPAPAWARPPTGAPRRAFAWSCAQAGRPPEAPPRALRGRPAAPGAVEMEVETRRVRRCDSKLARERTCPAAPGEAHRPVEA